MAAPAAGIGTALAWGTGDFFGGLAAKRQHVFSVVMFAQLLGLVLVCALALALREPFPAWRDLWWGAAAGLSGAVGVTSLYAALASGRMGIAAPVSGVVSAILPVSYAWIAQGSPSIGGAAGTILALVGIALVGGPKAERPPPRVLALSLLSGVGFAGFLLLMGLSSNSSFLWTVASARVASSAAVILLVLATRVSAGRPGLAVVGAGLGDTIGNGLFLLASRLGALDVAVVLSALYPIATVALARAFLKEHLTPTQTIGTVLLLGAIPLVMME